MGYTQAGVMRKLKLQSTSMISRWERGETMPNSDNLLKLSVLYKTLVNDLYSALGTVYQIELFPEEADRLQGLLKEEFPSGRDP